MQPFAAGQTGKSPAPQQIATCNPPSTAYCLLSTAYCLPSTFLPCQVSLRTNSASMAARKAGLSRHQEGPTR